MEQAMLPDQFRDLEQFSAWSLATERERNRKRLASPIAEIQSFYDAILPRAGAIIEYLNQFSLEEMPQREQRLFHMLLSLAEVANAVELFKQPGVIDGFDPERFIAMHE
jgi:hypothetical protein